MSYHSNPNSALPSPSHFDHPGAVELEPFPQYLPLRPEIPLFWCRRPVQITFGIILFLAILIGAVVASMFTGKSLRTAHYIKHPESPETIVMPTMKVTSNVTVTQTSVVASTTNVTVSSAQITAVATQVLREAYVWQTCSTTDAMCLVMVPQTVT
ncbi:hypothetical protein HBI56_055400 [Parastagonospora nodorum]|uniref:Uncharacterized protein n=1 Tax=Phaeosphaeria nodorum (strain SN15 / ATCC MYA-4574 / FGSC 10173) TaxID=321614 RepID=A0A7U2ICI5_PHANO|nr:hypothetical protein HBH56_096720 [Parastagonospora nodorum]QRD07263.1 hypothetical protein JI435_447140 [Parastagonospora nodorum SN15]KAH3930597.1 hypothetical protein HBH54_111040 [Parastagonospora nodorum]KAH3945156.1 hypothetical protein HBH53_148390 [Parastagonospora nodorum]KAH3966900.1 hypothetical protein HBH51_139800 [Parastagonospora nodorum]